MARRGRPELAESRSKTIHARVTSKEYNRVKWLAKTYASGDMSKWVRHGALNAARRYLK